MSDDLRHYLAEQGIEAPEGWDNSQTTADVLGQMPTAPSRALPFGSSNFKQFEWAKKHPEIAEPLAQLLQYLSMLPIGGGSKVGRTMGRDASMAHILERKALKDEGPFPYDRGITGGEPSAAAWRGAFDEGRIPARDFHGSSTELAKRPGMQSANRPAILGADIRGTLSKGMQLERDIAMTNARIARLPPGPERDALHQQVIAQSARQHAMNEQVASRAAMWQALERMKANAYEPQWPANRSRYDVIPGGKTD